MLGLALGGKSRKLTFGHRGANHPVKDIRTGRVYITSQNHGYVIDEALCPMTSSSPIATSTTTPSRF